MTVFLVIAALLTIMAAALLAWPLLRPRSAGTQLMPRSSVSATIVIASLPIAAFGIYFWTSNWSWNVAEHAATPAVADMRQLMVQLENRLAQQPDDVEGWKLLGRTAAVTGDYVLARRAFGEAYTRSRGGDADAVAGFAESLVLNDEREIDGQAAVLFERALELDPGDARALWYGGIVALRRGDLGLAQQRWVELQNHDLPPDLRQIVAERLAELRNAGDDAPAAPKKPPSPAAGAQITVTLAPSLAAQAPPAATLFIIARRGEAGPPLAVVRRAAGPWPVVVSMSDADAMLPGTSLTDGGPLRIVARISSSGAPTASRGDLFGEVGYDFSAAKPVQVTIDRVVP